MMSVMLLGAGGAGSGLAATLPSGLDPVFGLYNMLNMTYTPGPSDPSDSTLTVDTNSMWYLGYSLGSPQPSSPYPGASGQWLTGSGAAADYDVMFELLAGATNIGDLTDTWLNCATPRAWGVTQPGSSFQDCIGNLHIRPAGGGADLASCTVYLDTRFEP